MTQAAIKQMSVTKGKMSSMKIDKGVDELSKLYYLSYVHYSEKRSYGEPKIKGCVIQDHPLKYCAENNKMARYNQITPMWWKELNTPQDDEVVKEGIEEAGQVDHCIDFV